MGVSEEDIEYGDQFAQACNDAGISCEEISPEEFLDAEPNCNPNTQRVFKVKDGYIDPFLLTFYNCYDAKRHGARICTYSEVKNLLVQDKKIIGVKVYNSIKQKTESIFADMTINATGPWASNLERDLNLEEPIEIAPTMGTLLVIGKRLVNSLINRLRPPGDGDIIVPSHQSVLLGTTSIAVKIEDLDHLLPTSAEIDALLNEGEYLIPSIKKYRLIRSFAGARPLINSNGPLRDASRKFAIRNYEQYGYSGFITIIGGKMTTYRLMAEKIADFVCEKLGYHAKCNTAEEPLPGGERYVPIEDFRKDLLIDDKTAFDMRFKWGTFYSELTETCQTCLNSSTAIIGPKKICECENVTQDELNWVRTHFDVKKLDDYRRRTRQGMGSCQGQFCYYKLANLEALWTQKSYSRIIAELDEALKKRWKVEPIADEMGRRQIKLAKYMYLMGGNLE
jgi:glycerol-3-phosphate dehydrogenase